MDEATVTLLNEISQNAEMGKNTVRKLLQLCEDAALRHHLQKQLATYEDLSRRAHAMLAVEGALPKEQAAMTKMAASIGMTMQTMHDRSPRRMAEMLIEGNHVGATDLEKALRDAHGANEGAVALAQRLQQAENQYAEEAAQFL